MRAGLATALVAATVFSAAAGAACPTRTKDHCVDLGLIPQISQQIVDNEHIAAPAKAVPPLDPRPTYSGPIVGTAKNVRRAPTVGYRWSIE